MNQIGRYQILEELGRGACGVVYRALDPAIGRTVAIKSIRFHEFAEPDERRDIRERLLREAQSAGILSHPNIVTIYDVLESEDLAYIFMEYVDGTSLKEAMNGPAAPSREQLLLILRQLAQALDYAHRKGIVHRDIKPANIMLSDGRGIDTVAKIADFGVAKLASQESTQQQRSFAGTPSYMSPEQLEGLPVNGASDQFALGIVVYELLSGERPFTAENLPALHYAICKRAAVPVSELNPALNETVNRVMARALAKLPEDRFASCSEFIGALSVALGECPEWAPVPPKKPAQIARGNGWYSPETVISAHRSEESPEQADPVALTPVVLPPAIEPPPPNAVATRLRPDAEADDEPPIREIKRSKALGFGSAWNGRPARRMGTTAAACAVLAVLGVLIVHFLRQPAPLPANYRTRVIVPAAQPEDLTTLSRQASQGHAGPTVITPIATQSHATSTTVAVRTPAAPLDTPRPEPPPLPPPSKIAPSAPLNPPARTVPSSAPPSDVELVSDPPGARVVVDGSGGLSCLSPCSLPLTTGRHTLFAELSGYGTTRKIFNVPVEGSVFVSMTRNTGLLILTSEPGGARVSLDGQDLGPTPVKIGLPRAATIYRYRTALAITTRPS